MRDGRLKHRNPRAPTIGVFLSRTGSSCGKVGHRQYVLFQMDFTNRLRPMDCVQVISPLAFEVADFVQGCSGWHMLAQTACVAQPSETCRATSRDTGGIFGSGKFQMNFRSLTRHSLPERQAVPPESQTERSNANSATSKSLARAKR